MFKKKLDSLEENVDEEDEGKSHLYPHETAFFKNTEDLSTLPWKFKKMSSEEKNVLIKRYIDHVVYTKTGKNQAVFEIKWTKEVENAIKDLNKWKESVQEKGRLKQLKQFI